MSLVDETIIHSRPVSHKPQRSSIKNTTNDNSPLLPLDRPKTSKKSAKDDSSIKSRSKIPRIDRPRSQLHRTTNHSPTVSSNDDTSWDQSLREKKTRVSIKEKPKIEVTRKLRATPFTSDGMGDGIASLSKAEVSNEKPKSDKTAENNSISIEMNRRSTIECRVFNLRSSTYAAGRTVESIRKYPWLKVGRIQFTTGPVRRKYRYVYKCICIYTHLHIITTS